MKKIAILFILLGSLFMSSCCWLWDEPYPAPGPGYSRHYHDTGDRHAPRNFDRAPHRR